MNLTRNLKLGIYCGIAVCVFCAPAQADLASMEKRIPDIVRLKDKGLLCEKPDGLLGTIGSNPEAEKVAAAENKDRLETYKARASQQKHPLPTFMKVMGTERIGKDPSKACK